METITLKRSGRLPLRFEGGPLAEVSGPWHQGRECNRWHDLAVYRTAAGALVAATSFRSRWQGEDDRHDATVLAGPESLADWLGSLAVVPAGVGYPSGPAYADKQARLVADLTARYHARVTELYEALGPEFAEEVA